MVKDDTITLRVNSDVKRALNKRASALDMTLSHYLLYCAAVITRQIDDEEEELNQCLDRSINRTQLGMAAKVLTLTSIEAPSP